MVRNAKTRGAFNVGDNVMAKWLGSNRYYEAEILSIRGETCQVKFIDGTVNDLTLNLLKPIGGSSGKRQSPSRSTKVSRRSRSRSRSPSRAQPGTERRSPRIKATTPNPSPAKTQSRPSRQRSTSRSRTSASVGHREAPKVPVKQPNQKSIAADLIDRSVSVILTPLNTEVHADLLKVEEKNLSQEHHLTLRKRLVAEEIAMVRKEELGIDGVDSSPAEALESSNFKETKRKDFIYNCLGILLILFLVPFMPLLVLYLEMACTKDHCPWLWKPEIPMDLKSYYEPKIVLAFVLWALVEALLVALPVGKVVEGLPFETDEKPGPPPKFRQNGALAFLLTLGGLYGATFYLGPSKVTHDSLFQLIVTTALFSFILSIVVGLKAYFRTECSPVHDTTSSGSALVIWFYGSDPNPCFGPNFSLKIYCFRLGMIGWASVNFLLLHTYLVEHGVIEPNYGLFAVAFMQTLYVFTEYLQEESMITTYSFRREGLGYFAIMGTAVVMPFMYSIQTLYLANRDVPSYLSCLAFCGLLYFTGLYIARKSDKEKHAFRMTPHHPEVTLNSEVILTGKKRNLLSSGWWGFVRHPNYLGDILMFAAWSFPCGFHHWLPYLPLVFVILVLVGRSLQLDADCEERYGPAWQLYAKKVRWRILPFIF